MDNQQATLTTEDLAWLGGVIDSDGCLSLSLRKRKSGSLQYRAEVVISNCDPFFIEEASRILGLAEIGHWIGWKKPHKKRPKRMMGEIRAAGFKRVRTALTVLTPFIRAKKDQAETLLSFVERRLGIGYAAKDSYGIVDEAYLERMKGLKTKGAPETIRGRRIFAGEDSKI